MDTSARFSRLTDITSGIGVMKLTKLISVIGVLCFCSEIACAAEASHLGKYTFNWHKSPGKQRCIKIDMKLASRLSSNEFSCRQNEGKTEAGETVRACKRKAGGVEYLIFNTRVSCENEREAQDANSE